MAAADLARLKEATSGGVGSRSKPRALGSSSRERPLRKRSPGRSSPQPLARAKPPLRVRGDIAGRARGGVPSSRTRGYARLPTSAMAITWTARKTKILMMMMMMMMMRSVIST